MAAITLKGNIIHTNGQLPKINEKAPDFCLTTLNLQNKCLADFKDHKLILNIFPSVDTGTCASSVINFNKKASKLNNTIILCISKDLPFAQSRFCGAKEIENVIMLSDFKNGDFGKNYGLEIVDGSLKGLLSRCIVVIDENKKVIYTEQVNEIIDEPNYEKALNIL